MTEIHLVGWLLKNIILSDYGKIVNNFTIIADIICFLKVVNMKSQTFYARQILMMTLKCSRKARLSANENYWTDRPINYRKLS